MVFLDCDGSDPGMGALCYARPEWVVTPGPNRAGKPRAIQHACTKHLGEVTAKLVPESDEGSSFVSVMKYRGA